MAISGKSLYIPATYRKAYLREIIPLLFIIATALLFVSCESGVDSDAPQPVYKIDYDSIMYGTNQYLGFSDSVYADFKRTDKIIIQYEYKSNTDFGINLTARNKNTGHDIFANIRNYIANSSYIFMSDTVQIMEKDAVHVFSRIYWGGYVNDTTKHNSIIKNLRVYKY